MYDSSLEQKWNGYWREHNMFLFEDGNRSKPLYVIDTPPPNTNGDLHMGQAFWISYIDAIARYKRMKGFNVLYPQGWDTQGFPVELQVEKQYGKITNQKDFYDRCVEFANKNIQKMKAQMIELGASFDERYEYITMSPEYRKKIQLSLLLMHDKKMLYRANHPVEWCPHCKSSISREEVEEKENTTHLNHVKFELRGKEEGKSIVIATTRPELLHACVAVAVNPSDERYSGLVGKTVAVPIFGRVVPIISDESIEKDFGTGAEMVCTFGDKNDVLMFYKHKLEFIDSIDESGRLKNAGKFDSMAITEARAAILDHLAEEGSLIKKENIKNVIKIHDKCATPIEFISSMQWFIKTKEFAEKIKETAKEIKWIPDFTIQRLFDWCDYIEWDWNISRNRVFGTPIPFWYCSDCGHIIPASKDSLPIDPKVQQPPEAKCPACGSSNIRAEEKTCDVWVDSSITPLIISGWPDNKDLMNRAFPASIRIQGTDIIRTWAFYTIFRTSILGGDKPFEAIITSGMIQGTDGREMHKSFGNGVDPKDLIAKYSIDSVRLWAALSGNIGKDKRFSYEDIEFAKSFIIKLYNSSLFIKKILAENKLPEKEPHGHFGIFDLWILNRLNDVVAQVDKAYSEYDLYQAMNSAIAFYWHEFCDYYIENVKYRVYSEDKKLEGSKEAAIFTLYHVLNVMLRVLAPVMPHAAEEVNSMFSGNSIFLSEFPKSEQLQEPSGYVINGLIFKSSTIELDYSNAGKLLNDIIADVRKAKSAAKLALNYKVKLININLPKEYYSVVSLAENELKEICKADKVSLQQSENYGVSISE